MNYVNAKRQKKPELLLEKPTQQQFHLHAQRVSLKKRTPLWVDYFFSTLAPTVCPYITLCFPMPI